MAIHTAQGICQPSTVNLASRGARALCTYPFLLNLRLRTPLGSAASAKECVRKPEPRRGEPRKSARKPEIWGAARETRGKLFLPRNQSLSERTLVAFAPLVRRRSLSDL